MFRALLCSSSRGQNCIIQRLVSSHSVGGHDEHNRARNMHRNLFLNINQPDALNFIISLFQASTCFEHMFSSSGGQKLYYTVSAIITPIGVMIPETV